MEKPPQKKTHSLKTTMKTKPALVKGTCSFCEQKNTAVLSKNEKCICLKCLHLTSQIAGLRSEDAVQCDHCQQDTGFKLKYGIKTSLTFVRDSIDTDGITKYTVNETRGEYKTGMNPTACVCMNCKKLIRFWIVTRNKYATPFFTQEFVEKL